jgi:hypothetical protein
VEFKGYWKNGELNIAQTPSHKQDCAGQQEDMTRVHQKKFLVADM